MSKTVPVWILVILALSGTTGVVIWQLWHTVPRPENSHALSPDVGLPRVEAETTTSVVRGTNAVLWDTSASALLFEYHGFERRPIASITKLMTAMVALDYGFDWDTETTIHLDEYTVGGQLLLHPRETVRMRDLFFASLLGSANNATRAYVRELGVDEREFVRMMNRKAIELGLEQTEFVDVTGLNPRNVSTAYEVARLAEHAFSHYPDIYEATRQSSYTFTFGGSGREHTIRNTNKLISEAGLHFSGSKTGYLYEAGWCLVVAGEGELAGRVAVVLGSPSEQSNFDDTYRLLTLFPP